MILSIAICAALAILLIFSDLSWSNVLSNTRNDLVFAGRNQEYGAYALRREHPRNLFLSLLFVVGLSSVFSALGLKSVSTPMIQLPSPQITTTWVELDYTDKVEDTKPEEKVVDDSKTDQGSDTDTDVTVEPNKGLSTVDVSTQTTTTGDLHTDGGNPDGEEPTELTDPTKVITTTSTGDGDGSGGIDFTLYPPQMPEYVGGEVALYSFLKSTIYYPEQDRVDGASGTIYVSFIVMKDGSVKRVNVERGFRGSKRFEEAVLKAFDKMPNWIPGKNGNSPVNVKLTMPIKFTSL
ncbi:MAG: TonB family protein [Flavobacteriales bacterium]